MNKNFKKYLSIVLVVCLVLITVSLAACREDEPEETTPETTTPTETTPAETTPAETTVTYPAEGEIDPGQEDVFFD